MTDANTWLGKASSFGGGDDSGVSATEGLALVEESDLTDWWFSRLFVEEPPKPLKGDSAKRVSGLARCLNPDALYIAMRWGFDTFDGVRGEILQGLSREDIRNSLFIIAANGKMVIAQGVDFGPNLDTGRLVDCSPGTLKALGVDTDATVRVTLLGTFTGRGVS